MKDTQCLKKKSRTHFLGLAVLDALHGDLDLVSLLPGARDLGVELELESLLGADPLELLGDLHVDAHAADVAEELDGGHLGAKQVWSLSSFEPTLNDLNQVSSVTLLMTSSKALANEGLFELTRPTLWTRAVSLCFPKTTEEPGCSQVKRLILGQIIAFVPEIVSEFGQIIAFFPEIVSEFGQTIAFLSDYNLIH